MVASPNVPRIVYVPGARGIVARCPLVTVWEATIAPLAGSRTVMVPAPGSPGRGAHRGSDHKRWGPPTMYSPLINSVGPAVINGSLIPDPSNAEPLQTGFTQTVTNRPCRPPWGACLRIVWTPGASTCAPASRMLHPAFAARSRATESTRPVSRGMRHTLAFWAGTRRWVSGRRAA